jgi:hypothetical protein
VRWLQSGATWHAPVTREDETRLRSFREGLSGRIEAGFWKRIANLEGDDNLYDLNLAALIESPDLSNLQASSRIPEKSAG